MTQEMPYKFYQKEPFFLPKTDFLCLLSTDTRKKSRENRQWRPPALLHFFTYVTDFFLYPLYGVPPHHQAIQICIKQVHHTTDIRSREHLVP